MKIIAAIDLSEGNVIRLVRGDPKMKTIYSKDPISIAKQWERDGVDALHVVDIDATLGRGNNLKVIKDLVKEVKVPVEVAGGIRSIDSAKKMLSYAERIVLGTLAYKEPASVERLIKEYGRERIVIAIDHREGEVMINGWRSSANIDLISAIKMFREISALYFLITSIERDGTLQGPDLDLLKIACMTNSNIIASGGISNIEDVRKVKEIGAYGVILGKALYDDRVSIKEAKNITLS